MFGKNTLSAFFWAKESGFSATPTPEGQGTLEPGPQQPCIRSGFNGELLWGGELNRRNWVRH